MENKSTIKINPANNPFQNAVEHTPEISAGFRNGLTALGANSEKVTVDDTRKLDGSVDIDACTTKIRPTEPRWDYAIGYESKAYFLEVHPANTSNVQEMINKANWLKQWLNEKAPALKAIAAEDAFYWVPSGKYAIERRSMQYKKLAQSKILLIPRLKLPIKNTNK